MLLNEVSMGEFMKKVISFATCILLFSLLMGCASSSVSRLDDDEVVDVSGYWNDSDIAIVCDSLIEDCLSSSWTDRYRLTHGGDYPFIIIGDVLNNSSEHIDTAIITKKIEVALINNGINVVADIAMRDQIVAERKRQQYEASEETRAALGEVIGATYILQGAIRTSVDTLPGHSVRAYYVSLELVDIETSQKVWVGEDSVRKEIKRNKVSLF